MNDTLQEKRPALLVLAAGIGSRYGGLKQMDPVGPHGETIIDYSVYDAIRAGFGKLVFVIRRDIEELFKEKIGSRFEKRIQVEYAFQELDCVPQGFTVPANRKKPWGTAHAVLVAQDKITEPFGVINADDFYGRNSLKILADELQQLQETEPAQFFLVGFVLRNTLSEFGSVSRAICCCDATGSLQEVVEYTKIFKEGSGARFTDDSGSEQTLTGDELVSLNTWGFTPALFTHLREQFDEFLKVHGGEEKSEFFIPSVINRLLDSGKADVKVLRTPDSWFGVTYPEDKAHVVKSIQALIDQGAYPEKLWTS